MEYRFRHVETKEEVEACYELAMKRMHWMDDVGIKQWNVTRYDLRYPLSYYMSIRNDLYALEDEDGHIICAAALFESDVRWNENHELAFYVHHLASSLHAKHAGSIFLEKAEAYAKKVGKNYMRLDSAVDNSKLEDYYSSRGYVACGLCEDGAYKGILREKKL